MKFVIVLVTLLSCSDPKIELVSGPYDDRATCESEIVLLTKRAGPPSPGQRYECKPGVVLQ